MIYFIADTHFKHANIIKYCNRPYKTTSEMNRDIIRKWNEVVKPDDLVYHLGDVSFRIKRHRLSKIINALNGEKILVSGNHDKNTTRFYLDAGFSKVYREPIVLNNKFLLSHKPIADSNLFNVHGHTHNSFRESYLEYFSTCVSLENIGYRPISLDKIEELSFEFFNGR